MLTNQKYNKMYENFVSGGSSSYRLSMSASRKLRGSRYLFIMHKIQSVQYREYRCMSSAHIWSPSYSGTYGQSVCIECPGVGWGGAWATTHADPCTTKFVLKNPNLSAETCCWVNCFMNKLRTPILNVSFPLNVILVNISILFWHFPWKRKTEIVLKIVKFEIRIKVPGLFYWLIGLRKTFRIRITNKNIWIRKAQN